MAWNEPGGNDQDPWNTNKKRKNTQGPPDLDEMLRKVSSFFGGSKNNGSNGANSGNIKYVIISVIVIAILLWFASGFYQIKEAEQGVVTRFGKFDKIVNPGLNWKPTFIDSVTKVNTQQIRSLRSSGQMLTKDENMVDVSLNVQYRISNPEEYLYNVTSPETSLEQATDAALRSVIGDMSMENIITSGLQEIGVKTEDELNKIIKNYNMGLTVVDVNLQKARPPEQVKQAFDDAISAREDKVRYTREAERYRNDVVPKAKGEAAKIEKEAEGYAETKVSIAKGEVDKLTQLLPEFQADPALTKERLYLDAMEKVYQNTSKVLVDNKGSNNLLYLPIDKIMNQAQNKTDNPTLKPVNDNQQNSEIGTPPSLRNNTNRQGRN